MSKRNDLPDELPANWRWATFGEVAEYINGYGFSKSEWEDEGRPIIRIQNLTGTGDSFNYYSGEIDEKYVVTPGTLLISWSATLGAYIWRGEEALLNQHIYKVKPHDHVSKKYLYYVADFSDDELMRRAHGSGMKHVTKDVFESFPIPLPSLPEQRRIVAKIEELFSNLDAGMDDLQAADKQLERYRLSVLQAAVEGRLTADWRRNHDPEPADQLHNRIRTEKQRLYEKGEIRKPKERPAPVEDEIPFRIPDGWSWIRITELMYNWRSGLERRNSEQGSEREYPYIKMGDITNDGRLTLDSITRVDAEPEDVEKYKLSRGDFLFNVRNSKKLVGKSCVFDIESNETHLFNNNILRVDFGENVSTKYINYWFCSAAGRDMLEELKSSTTNVAAIYHKDFFTCIVPLPPLAEQKRIVDEVERLLSVADDAADTADREQTRAERLRQSILKQAFSGQLVPHEEGASPPSIDGTASEESETGSSKDLDSDVEDLMGSADPSKQIEMDL